ncbi:hypothetical protein DZA65_01827 [Dickeya dianthicola]|uniref:Uncharacterized protein n=1 Tax=Dickeya dianthicola TaxID=204039 RepID=A0ABX9NK49_9GAMM|nr:hypothetical protein [Dickeya dianthicola]AYC18718.1 hypothetical protein DZA65_01827 [Dickeya dianthicola]MBI0437216.1 hypothetical protein [Dickeya dianthicola]MBI0449450.1 hypothetical protein [Dickeya dianthicola]MBI0453939.1 hypothetical protein [Dickeya dianthicola]MBI0458124.1 hypothetical protein [Dickeya dianthicola]
MKNDKKQNQQSRSSGWGGKRTGAGAPIGNTNAVKHGERSRQAFFPLAGDNGRFTPLQLLRVRNLFLAERVGELMHRSLYLGTAEWREFMLLDGILWQHTKKMMVLERRKAKLNLHHGQH